VKDNRRDGAEVRETVERYCTLTAWSSSVPYVPSSRGYHVAFIGATFEMHVEINSQREKGVRAPSGIEELPCYTVTELAWEMADDSVV